MQIVGYADRFSVAPGEPISFMVSSREPRYRAEIVRLIHGDSRGPGIKEERIPTTVDGEYAGRVQPYPRGSYVLVAEKPALPQLRSFTVHAWVCPTTPGRGRQGLVSRWCAGEAGGFALGLDESGALALWLGASVGGVSELSTGQPLRAGTWYWVAASFDATSGRALLVQRPVRLWPVEETDAEVEGRLPVPPEPAPDLPLLLAACWSRAAAGGRTVRNHFNGRLAAPALFSNALDAQALAALYAGTPPAQVAAALVAAWDFQADVSSDVVRDTSGHALHGRTVNMPARGMTDHTWRGDETDWRRADAQYGAIHFHDDDLEDARWAADFTLSVPDGLRSGVYAARLTAGESLDYIPFFVRPAGRRATARALLLIPTYSYLAYANWQFTPDEDRARKRGYVWPFPLQDHQKYALAEQQLSLYDLHSDGSGVCYSSRLRPIANMRPHVNDEPTPDGTGEPHNLKADLHLVDWLEARGLDYDIATEDDLHREGLGLLAQYRTVMTGTHPEYWTGAMLDSLDAYLGQGGRFMYLGGNGFYWVTSVDPQRPHVIEVRRWAGTRAWTARPGEYHHSTTGELGGLWRERGRAPQRYVGVGFTAQGKLDGQPYRRQPASFDPRAAWIFAGVGPEEEIGGFGLVMGGAAGFEFDRADPALGTPPHALVLASATSFSDNYQHAVEEVPSSNSQQGGSVEPLVRTDIVFFEMPNGGAVYSVGSMSYCGSLSWNNYANNVSRITENVLRAFVADGPLPRG